MSSGKKYGPTQIYRFIADLCGQYEYHTPSLSWVKTNYYRYLPIVAKTGTATTSGLTPICRMPELHAQACPAGNGRLTDGGSRSTWRATAH